MRKWLQDKKKRLILSAAAGMAVCMLSGANTADPVAARANAPGYMAWWGTLYPKFCFSEKGETGEAKISFWLAELLDW